MESPRVATRFWNYTLPARTSFAAADSNMYDFAAVYAPER